MELVALLARARRLSIAALLALMVLSFSAAAASIFEVEERSKQTAGLTSIVVLAGNDAVSGLVAITHRVEVSGVNRTIVAIEGYVGSIVRFDEVIKVCNLGAGDLHVRLVYAGTVNGSWKYVRYLTFWLGGYDRGLRLTVDGETLEGASTGYLRVGPGECTPLSAEVLVDASAPPDVWRNALVSFETIVEPLERKA
jgi:hypothetical protein